MPRAGVLPAIGLIVTLAVLLPWLTWLADGGLSQHGEFFTFAGIPDSVSQRPTVVVLRIDSLRLAELRSSPFERGRHWERVGTLAILDRRKVRFESRVGVRLHGGMSRERRPRSFRLYFRPSLQAKAVPGEVLGFDGGTAYRTLVLHNDVRFDADSLTWHYLNPLAYDIAVRLGVPAARTTPATLAVNDERPRPYVITEFLNLDWLEARYGHRDFLVLETKDRAVLPAIRREGPVAMLRARFGEPENWTLENVREVVDVDNLSRWFLAILFCGTRDELQGKMVLDLSRPGAKWFWVAWDMDYGFGRKHSDSTPTWEYDTFHFWLDRDVLRPDEDNRVVILKQLFTHSAEFRRGFLELYTMARDSLLTPAFIEDELSRYERYATIYGIADREYQIKVRDFLTHRLAALDEILGQRCLIDTP